MNTQIVKHKSRIDISRAKWDNAGRRFYINEASTMDKSSSWPSYRSLDIISKDYYRARAQVLARSSHRS